MVEVGDRAPDFELPDADMNIVQSAQLAGRNYVIYFYPKDDTPGCTLEAQEFTDMMSEFEAHNTRLIGVSRDTCVSHGNFRDKYGLDHPAGGCRGTAVRGLRGVAGEGEERRETDGYRAFHLHCRYGWHYPLRRVWRDPPKGHAEKILDIVRSF